MTQEMGPRFRLQVLRCAVAKLKATPLQWQQRAKSNLDQQLLAWLLRKHTTASNRWISEHLHMGHISNVSNSVRRIDQWMIRHSLYEVRRNRAG